MQGTSKTMEMLGELTADPTIAAQLKAGTLNVQMIMGLWAMNQQQQQHQHQLDHQTTAVPFGMRSPIMPTVAPVAVPSPVAASAADTTTHPHTEDGGALDLSAGRRDSYETMRKTPSPYNGSSFSDMSPSSGSASSTAANGHHSAALHGPFQTHAHHHQQQLPHHQYPSPIESLHESKPMMTVYAPHIDVNSMPAYASPMTAAAAANSSAMPALGGHPISPYIMQRMAEAHHQQQMQLKQDQQQQHHEQHRIAAAAAAAEAAAAAIAPIAPSSGAVDLKPTRPFKTYPRDPLSIAATFSATDAMHGGDSPIKYVAFRKRMLDQIHESLGGHQTVSNPKMRRTKGPEQQRPSGDSPRSSSETAAAAAALADERLAEESATGSDGGCSDTNTSGSAGGNVKDAAYYERRQKNNAAAKKSRDRRRIKEDEITIRNAFLEKEVTHLRYENEAMKLQMMQNNLTPIFK